MADDNTIRVVEIIETEFGEKAVVDSPFEAKEYIKHLPFQAYEDEIDEYGSLKQKARARGENVKSSEMLEVFEKMESFGFSDDFAAHPSWNPNALGPEEGGWTIDRSAVSEAKDFWEYAGFSVTVDIDE